jgi:hypothetical protein
LTGRKTPLTLKQNTQLSELIQAAPSRKLLEESLIKTVRSCLLAAPFVFNWVDSLIVDPDELLLALSHLLLHSKVRGSVLWVGLEKSKCCNTFSGSAKIIYYFLKC